MADPTSSVAGHLRLQRVYAEGLVVFALIAWWLTSQSLPPGVVPGLLQIGGALVELAASNEFWGHAATTMMRVLLAVTLATIIGGAVGILPRYLPWTGTIVDSLMIPFFTAFPGIAWAILGTVWFGVTSTAVLIVQILIVVPFALVNASEGARAIGPEELEMGRSFTRNRFVIFWRIELRLLAPYLMASVRIAYGVCWKISLIAELFGAQSGVGYLMQLSQDMGEVDRIIAICLWIVAFVIIGERLVLDPLTRLVERGLPERR